MKSIPKPDGAAESHRIEIIIKKIDFRYIQGLFIDFFVREKSPTYPVFVKYDFSYRRIDPETIESTYKNFRIVEAAEDPDQPHDLLAKIIMQSYPLQEVVFIEMVKEDDQSLGKVKETTKEIIAQMEKMDLKIESVKPAELLPKRSIPAWEQIQDKGADREILKLWHEGYMNSEIGSMVGLAPRSITNILSGLRITYGEKIVPKKGMIRRALRDKK